MASSARIEQWILTGGRASSSAMCVFLIVAASSSDLPLIHSVTRLDEAIADPHPYFFSISLNYSHTCIGLRIIICSDAQPEELIFYLPFLITLKRQLKNILK